MSKRRGVSKKLRDQVIVRQGLICANKPGSNIRYLHDEYDCPYWRNGADGSLKKGDGYEIDHIKEVALGGTDDLDNLHLLCKPCHRIKTSNFNKIEPKGTFIITNNPNLNQHQYYHGIVIYSPEDYRKSMLKAFEKEIFDNFNLLKNYPNMLEKYTDFESFKPIAFEGYKQLIEHRCQQLDVELDAD